MTIHLFQVDSMGAIVRYTLLTALRSRLFTGLFLFIIVAMSISAFLGSTALVEQQFATLTYAAGATRFFLVIGLIIFVCQHVRSALDNKEIEFMLVQPISRAQFILGYWLGFIVIAAAIILPSCLLVGVMGYALFQSIDIVSYMVWAGSVLAECSLMIAFALVCALILSSSPTAILASFAFYILSRMISFFAYSQQSIHQHGVDALLVDYILTPISIILPRLDLFAKSSWLTYPPDTVPYYWLIQTGIYIPILLAMAVSDFQRKEF